MRYATGKSNHPLISGAAAVITLVVFLSSGFSAIASGAPRHVLRPPVISEGRATILPCTPQDQSTIGMMGCNGKHARDMDRRINEEVALIFTFLDPAEQLSLIRAEKAWLNYRNSDCDSVASLFQGGTIAPVVYGSCEVKDDQQYSDHLHGFYLFVTEGRGTVPRWP